MTKQDKACYLLKQAMEVNAKTPFGVCADYYGPGNWIEFSIYETKKDTSYEICESYFIDSQDDEIFDMIVEMFNEILETGELPIEKPEND